MGQKVHIVGALCFAHDLTIDLPLDVVRRPFNDVVVPSGVRLEAYIVTLIMSAPLVYDVHAEWIGHRGDNLDINLVPLTSLRVWSAVVQEK